MLRLQSGVRPLLVMAVTAGTADGVTFNMLSSFLCYENTDFKSCGLCLEVHVSALRRQSLMKF